MARADGQGQRRLPRRAARQRNDALHPLHQRLDRQTQGHSPHDRRLPVVLQEDLRVGLRPPRGRRVLVHRRLRLGHRPQLRRLRPAGRRGHGRAVRRGAESSARRPLLGDRRKVSRVDLLHGAHRHSRVHEVGRPPCREARPVELAAARHGRRGHQPRSVDVVPPQDRRRAVSRSSTPGGRPKPAAS